MKWYEYLSDWEKPISQYIEKTFVPEKTPWWGIPAQLGFGSVPKQWQEKSKFLGDTSSRGWLGPVNLWQTGQEGKNAFGAGEQEEGAPSEGSRTTRGLKVTGTLLAAIASMYGLGQLGGTFGGAGGTSGSEAGTGATSTGWYGKVQPYMKYGNLLKSFMGQGGSGGGTGQAQQSGTYKLPSNKNIPLSTYNYEDEILKQAMLEYFKNLQAQQSFYPMYNQSMYNQPMQY